MLSDVTKLVEGVARGICTFQELSGFIGKVERQGRYYRRAAEILGFITNEPMSNHSVLTPLGQEYISAIPSKKKEILAQAVLGSRMFQRVIPFLESRGAHGISRKEMEKFISEVTEDTGPSMIPRRVSSVMSWMLDLGMLKEINSNYVIGSLPQGVAIVDYEADDEPLFPKKYDLNEYRHLADNVRKNSKTISIFVDEAKRDRASQSHRLLTNLMADRIRDAGFIPKRNPFIDLSAKINDWVYIFEMKSTTESNVHDQVRRGISQLYEYRYIQQIERVKLVLVVENPFSPDSKWLVDYLIKDRGILVVWDGDRKNFNCPKNIRKDLSFI